MKNEQRVSHHAKPASADKKMDVLLAGDSECMMTVFAAFHVQATNIWIKTESAKVSCARVSLTMLDLI